MAADPITEFRQWFETAQGAAIDKPEAMTLATVNADGSPSVRIVLLKDVDASGFVFYTNYRSHKAQDMETNPRAALLFFWDPLGRQVRVEGAIEKVSAQESDDYFATRPRGSQLGAWASPQSEVVMQRETLDQAMQQLEQRYRGKAIPRPPHWGGYRLRPDMLEFWQARADRMHDRMRYRLSGDGKWTLERLAP